MIGKKKVSKRNLKKTSGRIHVGQVKFKEIPCGGSAYINVNAIPSWGVYLFMDASTDVEVGFDYDGCKELVRQLTRPLNKSLIQSKHFEMVGDDIPAAWCAHWVSEEGKAGLLVQRCQGFVRLTVGVYTGEMQWDFDVIMDGDAAKRLADLIAKAISSDIRSPRMK